MDLFFFTRNERFECLRWAERALSSEDWRVATDEEKWEGQKDPGKGREGLNGYFASSSSSLIIGDGHSNTLAYYLGVAFVPLLCLLMDRKQIYFIISIVISNKKKVDFPIV